jgi:hypothetical protein
VILDGTNKVTRLQFGYEEITINPVEYAMVDPNYTRGQLVYPQRSNANMGPHWEVPEHPDERAAEGPEEAPDEDA